MEGVLCKTPLLVETAPLSFSTYGSYPLYLFDRGSYTTAIYNALLPTALLRSLYASSSSSWCICQVAKVEQTVWVLCGVRSSTARTLVESQHKRRNSTTAAMQSRHMSSAAAPAVSKAAKLKHMLESRELAFLMEAHNGLSARIVEETGFQGIWASGLSISAQLGVRDSNEASWTQVLDVLEFMSDATDIPILLDGDTGYGNFNNARRLVRKLEQRGIAGVCLEDKMFPKTNSFIESVQPLADITEFCGKISACKDTQHDPDFCVVARVEALIAGWGHEEAIKRAEAYRKAGADAVLIHSKKGTGDEIEAFMKEWDNRHPVVIVPTKYYRTPTEDFKKWGVSTIIWANHNMRASITAMQHVCSNIYTSQHLRDVEDKIAPVSEVFRLQQDHELREAEKKYLPQN